MNVLNAPNLNTFVATRCAICRLPLTDAMSIQIGIGPDCRKGHGFEQSDCDADWGRALFALGARCDDVTYQAVLDAYGPLAARGVLPWSGSAGFGGSSTKVQDVRKACRVLVHRLSTAFESKLTKEDVIRTIAAIYELGYTKLARALVKAMRKKREYRDHYGIQTADVTTVPLDKATARGDDTSRFTTGTTLFRLEASYNRELINRLYALPWSQKYFNKLNRTWLLAVPRVELFNLLVASGLDLISGVRPRTDGSELSSVSWRKSHLADPDPVYAVWTAPCSDDDRCWWVTPTGAQVRPVVPGEPRSRPGLERVPEAAFQTTLALVH